MKKKWCKEINLKGEGSIIYLDNNWFVHRDNDLPAVESLEGSAWYKHGFLHRENGPAIINKNGQKIWYIEGQSRTEEEFKLFSEKKKLNEGLQFDLKHVKNKKQKKNLK